MTNFMSITEFFFTIVIGIYFLTQLTSNKNDYSAMEKDSKEELERLNAMRKNKLTEPLTEQARPKSLNALSFSI